MAKFVFIGQDLFNQRAASSNPTHFYINRARRGELAKSLPLFDLAYALISGDDGDDYEKHRNAILKLESWVSGGLLVSDDQGRYTPEAVIALQARLDRVGLWSEGVQHWCGVWADQWSGVQVQQSAPAAAVYGWVSHGRMRTIAAGKCKNIDSLIKNRPRSTDAVFIACFNEADATINVDAFITWATNHDHWIDGPSALAGVMQAGTVHRFR